jgi:hypothetical protein
MLMENIPLKLVSLGLATLLWFVIAGEKTSEMGVSAPLELQNFPKDLEVTGEPVDNVEVRLRASPGIIQRIGPGDVSAQLDLAGLQEGEHIVHLTDKSIRMPFGVKVVKITPSLLTLNLERTLQKVVPVRPRLVGRPAPGFEVGDVRADPAEVRIAGPRSRVQEVESAFTEPLSIEGAQAGVSDVVNMGLDDPLLRVARRRTRRGARRRDVAPTGVRTRGGRRPRLALAHPDPRRRPRVRGRGFGRGRGRFRDRRLRARSCRPARQGDLARGGHGAHQSPGS